MREIAPLTSDGNCVYHSLFREPKIISKLGQLTVTEFRRKIIMFKEKEQSTLVGKKYG